MKKLFLLMLVVLGLGSAGVAQTAKKAGAKPASKQIANETKSQKRSRIVREAKANGVVGKSAVKSTQKSTQKSSALAQEIFVKEQ